MNTPDWVKDAIFYQIFPDRFARSKLLPDIGFEAWDSPPTSYGFKGGDLFGVLEKLDYLVDLGITALYLTPIFSSASNHRYHTYDYYKVDPLLGGNEALRTLIDEAHRLDIRIVLDGVFNHASRGFWQFHHVLENRSKSPFIDWFHFDSERLNGNQPWSPYPSELEEQAIRKEGSLKAIGYQGWWNLPALPKFNTDTPAVREFLFGVAEHWIKFGIDGWRLDVPSEIDDDSFWQAFRERVRAINPEAYIVGEIWDEAERWLQGDQFDAAMNYLLTAALLSFFGGRKVDLNIVNQAGGLKGRVHPGKDATWFANEIDRLNNLYPPDIIHSQLNLLDSHDMPRFITCVNEDLASMELAMLFLFTYSGAPCLFYGDEIGLAGEHDPDCRKGFPWEEASWNRSLLNYTKNVIDLRKNSPALRHGSYESLLSEGLVYAFVRKYEGETIIPVFNAGTSAQTISIPVEGLNLSKTPEVLFGQQVDIEFVNKQLNLTIPGQKGSVLRG